MDRLPGRDGRHSALAQYVRSAQDRNWKGRLFFVGDHARVKGIELAKRDAKWLLASGHGERRALPMWKS